MVGLTHFDAAGKAQMVDVSDKPATARRAVARGCVAMAPETLALVTEGTAAKGDVLSVAALTVYDMLKAVDRGMVIGEVRLALKEGGKSGRFEAP